MRSDVSSNNTFHIAGTLGGIFSQIVSEDDVVREKAIKFLNYSVQLLLKEVFHPNPDMEMFLFEEIKKVYIYIVYSFFYFLLIKNSQHSLCFGNMPAESFSFISHFALWILPDLLCQQRKYPNMDVSKYGWRILTNVKLCERCSQANHANQFTSEGTSEKAVLDRLVQSFKFFTNLGKQFSYKFRHVNIKLYRFVTVIYLAKRE